MKIKHLTLLLSLTLSMLVPASLMAQDPVILRFSTGTAGSGGVITTSGSHTAGSNIPIDKLVVTGAPGAPAEGLVFNVDGPLAATANSNGTTGALEFDSVKNIVRIVGSIPSLGVIESALLQGSFSNLTITPSGAQIEVVAQGPDLKSNALMRALGLPVGTPFELFGFTVAAQTSDSTTFTALNTDITNTAVCKGGIGNFVWNDLDQDGIQDAGEPGIPNITVELWDSTRTRLLAIPKTDANGFYRFIAVCGGTYILNIPSNQPGLFGLVPSTTYAGGNPEADSNQIPETVVLPNDTVDNSFDFGYHSPTARLTVNKTPDNGVFTLGSQVSFQIVVSNTGGAPANNVVLTDALPSNGGLVWAIATPTQGSCTIASGKDLSCTLGSIAAGSSVTVTVQSTANTPPEACTLQPNPSATATADGPLKATDSGSLNCIPPQLRVVKTPDNGTFTEGGQVTFTIVVSNPAPQGASPATNVSLSDSLPGNGGLTFTTATTTQGSCSLAANLLSCNLGSIAAGGSVTVEVSSAANTPSSACTSQPNPAAMATADGGLNAQDSGSVSCTPVLRSALGDFVWYDTNGNGQQDTGEAGIPNITVRLYRCDGTFVGQMATDATGHYLFSELMAGCYYVVFVKPSNYVFTTANSGNDATDSDAGNGGMTGQYNLAPGQTILTVDAGMLRVGDYESYTQGGWGAPPQGDNIAMKLATNFSSVYPRGVTIGGNKTLKFTSQPAIYTFLPIGGTPRVLTASYTNPSPDISSGGVFAGQVLALRLNVDFSNAGLITPGLANLRITPGHPLAGRTVLEVLALANAVLGGNISLLPAGMSVSDLSEVVDALNNNFVDGTTNNGWLH